MNIGLIDVDKTRFPNLALGKIAAYHRSLGDSVEWADPMFGIYDRVYASKVFVFTPDFTDYYDCEVVKGGTGYDYTTTLPDYIDRLQPDYSIYSNIDSKTAYGFLTRGCPNKCKWCIVPLKEGNVHPYMDVEDITQGGRRTNIILMDNNVLASDYGISQLEKIADKGYRIDLNQGNSARLVNDEIAGLFARIRWIGSMIRFAAESADKDIKRRRYNAMLLKVLKWQPPTPEHEGLKKFMIDQLHGSIGFDCSEYRPVISDREEYIARHRSGEYLKEELDFYEKQWHDEIERTNSRNKWLKELRESLKEFTNEV